MAHIVVLGAGLGGVIMAYEMRDQLRKGDKLTVITKEEKYHFVPSNPWVAVNWRTREEVEIDLTRTFAKRKINFIPVAAKGVHPTENCVELENGQRVDYDYLIICTGPELAFDEIEGLGPNGNTHVDLPRRSRSEGSREPSRNSAKTPVRSSPAPCKGASCFGPAYEFTFILDTELRRTQDPRPRADDLRHLRALYRPSRPRRRRRHQGHARRRDARASHQVDHERSREEGRGRQDDRRGGHRRRVGQGRRTSCPSPIR